MLIDTRIDKKEIIEQFFHHRLAQDWSLRQAAEKLEISRQHLGNIENHVREAPERIILKMIRIIGFR